MGTHFDAERRPFRYTPPTSVPEDVVRECKGKAEQAARVAGTEFDSTGEAMSRSLGFLFGFPGALSGFAMAYETEEVAYKDAFEACLVEKGY